MRDNYKSNYLFYEKFIREFCENLQRCDFFDINRMYSDLSKDMKKIFLGPLNICKNESYLFDITKIKILNTLENILIDVHKTKSKKKNTLQDSIDFTRCKSIKTEKINLKPRKEGISKVVKNDHIFMYKYRK